MTTTSSQPVLILGAGINGCALARELALNGQAVWIVDSADIASGATSGSSRLIHGGLRYLEYGELDLVKESLAERTRLLKLAPQFVHPLKLWVPAENRFGGTWGAIGRFFGWQWWPAPKHSRGAVLVGAGLTMYDAYARDPSVPKHERHKAQEPGTPPVDRKRYRWLSSYYDGQVTFPERLVQSMLVDAGQLAAERGTEFRVLTYRQARLNGDTVEIVSERGEAAELLRPSLIVNATGAWVDETLARLHVPADRLMGGTKGSHLFTFSPRLIEQLAGQGIYAEASDGRPIFITPLDRCVLIGTTDQAWTGPPQTARATEQEIEYLINSVNQILPDTRLRQSDIAFHYSAVRPLPFVHAKTTGAITRRHFVVENTKASLPIVSLVGGKLTTMRSLAEESAAVVLKRLGREVIANSRTRPFPGSEGFPTEPAAHLALVQEIAERTGYSDANVAAAMTLHGTRCDAILSPGSDRRLLPDTELPLVLARWAIDEEHAVTLADLVERRLMLLYHARLTRACLQKLAELLAERGRLEEANIETAVDAEVERLASRYGKTVR